MNGDIICVEALMHALQKYTDISGQVINYSKSSLITSQKPHMSVQADIIATATGFTKAALPILYLGVPLFRGRAKFHYFQELINKFEKKLSGWKSRLLSFEEKITLLKSVLTSLPIHSLSVIKAPMKLLKKLESIMANFLWNAKDNHRRHWIAWDKVCRTLDEGGLGVRSLFQIMNALHAKRCWAFIKGESLWAQYMYRKYGDPRDAHYSTPTFSSPLWRNMMKVLPKVTPHLQWIIGRGNIPIWGTNWCGIEIDNPPRFRYNPNISQIMQSHRVRTRSGRYVDIRQYLPPAATALLATLVLTDEPDQVCWTLEHHGEFTTKSYWEYNRHHFPTVAWRNNFWNKYVPPRIGAFLWRLSHNAIPVDERLTGIGFKLASKCVCCAMPSRETLDHLFVNSETAKPIWSHFAQSLNIPNEADTISKLGVSWLHDNSLHNKKVISKNLIFGLCIWEIWKQRNKIIFDNGKINHLDIITRVSFAWQDALRIHKLDNAHAGTGAIPSSGSMDIGNGHGWTRPGGGLKLNIGGITGDEHNTADGMIIRDHNGDMVLASHKFCTNGTHLLPECDILLEALQISNSNNLQIRCIETTNQKLQSYLHGTSNTPWATTYIIRAIKSLIASDTGVFVIPRGANGVAQALATAALSTKVDKSFSHTFELPDWIGQAVAADL
ncbi:uncharacterized protein M6B38_296285 [Iris pallida]|uniref:Reverse transcriptase zinc-binding domain-containing protein n=1 Tax=Iris pallida TaxID=29817 RepID=A0AAX6HQU7_IRIPA|nr:uncharacterized protein M6B38_296285 [Iris pallida]